MAKARNIPGLDKPLSGLDKPLSFKEAAKLAVDARADEVWEHEHSVLDTADIEGVHDMRVATRRLRAAMEIFESCFPKKQHKRKLREVKRLADALGERRDPDVMIERLQAVEAGLTNEDRPGIESLIDELRAGQADANTRLERELVEARKLLA